METSAVDHAKMVLDLSRPEVPEAQALRVLTGIPGKILAVDCPETRSRLMMVVVLVAERRKMSLPRALIGELVQIATRDSNARVYEDFESLYTLQAERAHSGDLLGLVASELARVVTLYEAEGGFEHKREADRERRQIRNRRKSSRYESLCNTVQHLQALEVRATRLKRLLRRHA
jgi:hypothetical protein